MRLVAATLTLSAAAVLSALAPAHAGDVTISVPGPKPCEVVVTYNDIFVSANSRDVTFHRSGHNSWHQTCIKP
jgi:hypothetical protein